MFAGRGLFAFDLSITGGGVIVVTSIAVLCRECSSSSVSAIIDAISSEMMAADVSSPSRIAH